MSGPDQGPASMLPDDADEALLVGRAWSRAAGGPIPVLVRDGRAWDLSRLAPTVSQLFEQPDLANRLRRHDLDPLGPVPDAFGPERWRGGDAAPLRWLAPVDLQCLKACGVTFAVSVMERVVEEQAKGDLKAAQRIRAELTRSLGRRLEGIVPGSAEAESVKQVLQAEGLWSQYLEVAIGPDAEVFTKSAPLSAVGWGDWVGIRDDSDWNNPEPEVALICDSKARIVGATLGNDVNLRDFEGRSALLLGQAKDNNASAALGPFVRVFDEGFTVDDLRTERVTLAVDGTDDFRLRAEGGMHQLSRAMEDLVNQVAGRHHDYPDGFVLYLGSMVAPTQDRDVPGEGFTHHRDDLVTVSSPRLGSLVNRITSSADAPRWTFGIGALIDYLGRRAGEPELTPGATDPDRPPD